MTQKELNQFNEELRSGDYNQLVNALVTCNGDTYLIECEEDAAELAECILAEGAVLNEHTPSDTDEEEWVSMCEQVDGEPDKIDRIYRVYNYNDNANHCLFVLSSDWTI